MKVTKLTIFRIINNWSQKSLSPEGEHPETCMFLAETLFPGIDYDTLSDFEHIKNKFLKTVLQARYPKISSSKKEGLDDEEVQIDIFKTCKGFEWKTVKWQKEFQCRLKNLQNH